MTGSRSDFPYRLDPRAGIVRLGLVVLQVDETVEQDFRRLLPVEKCLLHVTCVPSGAELTPEPIVAMEDNLSSAASLCRRRTPTMSSDMPARRPLRNWARNGLQN